MLWALCSGKGGGQGQEHLVEVLLCAVPSKSSMDAPFMLAVVACWLWPWGATGPCPRVKRDVPDTNNYTTLRRTGSNEAINQGLSAVLEPGEGEGSR